MDADDDLTPEEISEDNIRRADERLKAAMAERLSVGAAEIKQVLEFMMDWVPEDGWPETRPCAYGPRLDRRIRFQEVVDQHAAYREQDGPDDATPFFSECYLYELMGKEDARTILAQLDRLARAIGYETGIHGLRRERRAREEKTT